MKRPFLLVLAVAAIAAALPPVMRPWICDDTFITLRYVRNASAGLGLVYNAGERVEGYTHFLWTILLWFFARLGIDPVHVGTWLPVPFYVGTLWLLLRTSRALWPQHPTSSRARTAAWLALPVAALTYAVHRDAMVFASGGLETSAYTFALLLGCVSIGLVDTPRSRTAGMAAYAGAALLRPEGLLHAGIALAFVALRFRRELPRLLVVLLVLVAPLYAWRWVYYHDVLPNAYYAKSAGHAYWSQGWFYVGLYLRYYAGIGIAAALGMLSIARACLQPRTGAARRGPHQPLALAMAHALVIVVSTAYVGGDFMFARFLLPATPFLVLAAEHAVRAAPRARAAWAVALVVATLAGGLWRERTLRWPAKPRGIVDERSFYPPEDIAARRAHGEAIAACIAQTDAGFLVLGAQAMLAYFGRFPVAIEVNGLTDRTIARQPLVERGRPGHERKPTMEYLLQRRVRFMILQPGTEPRRPYARIRFGAVLGEIVSYDGALMDRVRRCHDVEFVDFPAWLDEYLRRAADLPIDTLARDLAAFRIYYFDHNDDPERLGRLQTLLQQKRDG